MIKKIGHLFKKHRFLIVYFAIIVIIQLTFAILLTYTPAHDAANVFNGAISLSESGSLPDDTLWYFAMAKNNFGLTFLMSLVFRAASVFTDNYYIIFAIVNIVTVDIGVFFLYELIRSRISAKTARIALLLLFLYIPLYFFPAMLYTDTATMCLPIICIGIYHRICSTDSFTCKTVVLAVLLGILTSVGYAIKPTAAIILIAIVLISLFIRKARLFARLGIALTAAAAVIIVFNVIYNRSIPEKTREDYSFPPTHWVMMGLQNNGQVSWSEFEKTLSYATYAEKNAGAVETIKERLKQLGFGGWAKLALKKIGVLYSRPDFAPGGIIVFDSRPASASLNGFRLNNPFYLTYNGIFFYGAFALAFISIFFKKRDPAAYLALLGVNLFFIMWEVNPKYLQNYFLLVVYLASISADNIAVWLSGSKISFRRR